MKEIKEAFEKVKLDIFYLSKNYSLLKDEINFLNEKIDNLIKDISISKEASNFKEDYKLKEKEEESKKINKSKNYDFSLLFPSFTPYDISLDIQTDISTRNGGVQTDKTQNKTDEDVFKPLKHQNQPISIGNRGVQTDRQTYRQTDNYDKNSSHNQRNSSINKEINSQNKLNLNEAIDILGSLASFKKELRIKFKRLTDQEFLVFSTIFQLEDEYGYSDYKMLSNKLNLTESSIRDYVRRLILKDIPIEKTKINNKEINLKISENLKRIATLDSIIQLINL
jgi:hypothetical protein